MKQVSNINKERSFWLLMILLISALLSLGYVTAARASTLIVKSGGEIEARDYKPSYLVKNNISLPNIEDSRMVKARRPRQAQWIVTSYPGSTIKTKKRPNKSITIMGVTA